MSIFNHVHNIIPSNDQKKALTRIEEFIHNKNDIFILKGYAGSGKTTLIKGISNYLRELQRPFYLMTPTGRAAKVLSEKTNKEAATIHRTIYSFNDLKETEVSDEENNISYVYYFKIRKYDQINTVFIVDEASMVSDQPGQQEFLRFGSGKLLYDLIDFSRIQNPEANSKIIFVGDPAQLPPVDMNKSPALDAEYLLSEYKLKCQEVEIREIKRQTQNSGILNSASKIRKCLTSGFFNDFDLRDNGHDLLNTSALDFLSVYKNLSDSKIIITYKNKTASALNRRIRIEKYGKEEPLKEGDRIIISANNYKLLILNGEFGIVSKVGDTQITRKIQIKKKGFFELKWRYIELLLPDNHEVKEAKGYFLENYLYSDNDLSQNERLALYIDFKIRFANEYKNRGLKVPNAKSDEFKEAIKADPYYHAIMLKFGHAITCHKAQGGEWNDVITIWDRGSTDDQSFYTENQSRTGRTNRDFYRWAYTAITRATTRLFCLNPPYFNSFTNMTFVSVEVQKAFNELTAENEQIEIEVTNEHLELLSEFNLESEYITYQDHFVKLFYLVQQYYVEITGWRRIREYEFWIKFNREEKTTTVKFTNNKQHIISDHISKISAETTSDELFMTIFNSYSALKSLNLNRTTFDTVLSKIEFDLSIEESYPFLKTLYDSIENHLKAFDIHIKNVEHKQYHEKYTLARNIEKLVVHFEYNASGFIGRVLPIDKECNSQKLLDDLSIIIEQIKNQEYVI